MPWSRRFDPAAEGQDNRSAPELGNLSNMDDHANPLIMQNAARLLADAKLLADHARFASAFALAVLGVEEIGKVILNVWASAEQFSKPVIRRTPHVRKQAAVGSL